MHESLLKIEIDWKFNVPNASHMGRAWETMVRTVRDVLQVLLKKQVLNHEGLSTVFCQVENIVNSRPLTYVSSDSHDLQPITPNDLPHMKETTVLPPGWFVAEDAYTRRRWRQVAYIAEAFWRRWSREYLASL
jgi:hypothetical protein